MLAGAGGHRRGAVHRSPRTNRSSRRPASTSTSAGCWASRAASSRSPRRTWWMRTFSDLVRLEVEEFVAGSFLEGAPIVPVSAITGAGSGRTARRARAGGRARFRSENAAGCFRLPIDRVFSVRGLRRCRHGNADLRNGGKGAGSGSLPLRAGGRACAESRRTARRRSARAPGSAQR